MKLSFVQQFKIDKHTIPYVWIVYLISLPAGLMIGLQFGLLARQYERAKNNFADDVEKAVVKTREQYAQLNAHTSSPYDKSSYDYFYSNADSTFMVMVAQSAQRYPLLDFKPDTALPPKRLKQFKTLINTLEQTRQIENKRLKEFYVLRSIQYCVDCERQNLSVAQIFPLDSLLRNRLRTQNIDNVVQIGFYDGVNKRFSYLAPGADSVQLAQTAYRFVFTPREEVRLYFPGFTQVLLTRMLIPIVSSVVLIFFSLVCYLLAYRLLMRQKKLTVLKNDFINNVTHEFKTPIATIAFALANIENEQVLANPALIRQFTKVIKEENQRLNGQVEQVLQAALLDKQAPIFKKEPVDLHAVLQSLADTYSLKIQPDDSLTLHLDAPQATLQGDVFHLTNAFSNLIDNALKYSQSPKIVSVHTENIDKGIRISVSDNGMGISPEHQSLIFDKFFRVQQGNVHDVKGFGLGLSYVKEIVLQHKGTIKVQSKLNEGSTFIIFLPLI